MGFENYRSVSEKAAENGVATISNQTRSHLHTKYPRLLEDNNRRYRGIACGRRGNWLVSVLRKVYNSVQRAPDVCLCDHGDGIW